MTDYSKQKAGDVVEVPGVGKVKLTRPMYRREWQGDVFWVAPGYRWIKSRQAFSGNDLLHNFQADAAEDAPSGTAAERLAWYADRNLLRA